MRKVRNSSGNAAKAVQVEARDREWPAGKGGLWPIPVGTWRSTSFQDQDLVPAEWLDRPHVSVSGIPFEVPSDARMFYGLSMGSEGSFCLDVPAAATELLVLLKADYPEREWLTLWDGITEPVEPLVEPERVFAELTYTDGTSDEMIPIQVGPRTYGIVRGVAAYAVHPSPGKSLAQLRLHSRMKNAAFTFLAVTANTGVPKVQAPERQPAWYPPVKKVRLGRAEVSFNSSRGLTWGAIESGMLPRRIDLSGQPVFSLKIGKKEIRSSSWRVREVTQEGQTTRVLLTYARGGISLRAAFEGRQTAQNEVVLSLEVTNEGSAELTGALRFPTISRLAVGSVADTWYLVNRDGVVVNRVPVAFRDHLSSEHPMQVDGFFNPAAGVGIAIMPRDTEDTFRWYEVGKDETGGSYALEFSPRTVAPGSVWSGVPVAIAVIPGDWKDQVASYAEWVKTWHRPASPRKTWYQKVFLFGVGGPDRKLTSLQQSKRIEDVAGYVDYLHLYGWAGTEQYGSWGDYDHYDNYGGREKLIRQIRQCQKAGIPVGLYLDAYLVSPQAANLTPEQKEAWAIHGEDGKPVNLYRSYSMCPYVKEWRDYLTSVYTRLAKDLKVNGLYVDEIGLTMLTRTCHNPTHGHPVPMHMSPGEGIIARQIREALPTEMVTYGEMGATDVLSQYIDGTFSYIGWWSWRSPAWMAPHPSYDEIAPHYVNLRRFVFPDFKNFQLIHEIPLKNGNWFLLKYPFFTGDGYYLRHQVFTWADDRSRSFLRTVFRIYHEYVDAFTSRDVEPLVQTEVPGLFANRFSAPKATVFTLLNANYRTIQGDLLKVPHVHGARYLDAWNQQPLQPRAIMGDKAVLALEMGPRSVGCVVQQHRHKARPKRGSAVGEGARGA